MSADAGKVFEDASAVSSRVTICNAKGLHARASAKLVEVVEAHDAEAEVSRDGLTAGGDSIMGLMVLAATQGSTITIRASGPQADAVMDALGALVARKFDED